MIGDTAYGNVEVREQLEQRAIRVLAPLHITGAANDGTIAQGRVRDRPRPAHGHLPAGQDGPDLQAAAERARADGTRVARFYRNRLRALPAARALRARRPRDDPHQPPRRPPPSRAARARRPRPARPPQTHPTTHRTAARPDRLPLPRPHQPLQRRPQNRTPSRLDRHPGQPAPDRRRTTSPDPLARGRESRPTRPEPHRSARMTPRPAKPHRRQRHPHVLPSTARPHTHARRATFSGTPDLDRITGTVRGRRWSPARGARAARIDRRSPGQVAALPAQLGNIPSLVDEVGGKALQCEPETLGAHLGCGSRQHRGVRGVGGSGFGSRRPVCRGSAAHPAGPWSAVIWKRLMLPAGASRHGREDAASQRRETRVVRYGGRCGERFCGLGTFA